MVLGQVVPEILRKTNGGGGGGGNPEVTFIHFWLQIVRENHNFSLQKRRQGSLASITFTELRHHF